MMFFDLITLKKKNEKYKHRTVEELIELAEKNPREFMKTESQMPGQQTEEDYEMSIKAKSKIKIIDMTGKEQRVMHGYESISQMTQQSRLRLKEDKEAKLFSLPELTNNLDLIVMMTEDKILLNDKK
jgi:tuftelin-interacting protein 11